jgi:hypothetical protein
MYTSTCVHRVKSAKLKAVHDTKTGTLTRSLILETMDGGTFDLYLFFDHGVPALIEAAEGPATPSEARRFRSTGKV